MTFGINDIRNETDEAMIFETKEEIIVEITEGVIEETIKL